MRSVIFQLVIIVVLGVVSVKFRIRLLFSVVCLKTIFTLLIGQQKRSFEVVQFTIQLQKRIKIYLFKDKKLTIVNSYICIE